MKSGPTLCPETTTPRARSAAIKPVAMVVLPWPEPGAAMISRATTRSPLDPPLALLPGVHRMLHLGHLHYQIGGLDQRRGRVPAGDHHVLAARPVADGSADLGHLDPAPFQRIGELVEHGEVVARRCQPARDLSPPRLRAGGL